jgi:hypothetical protein
MDPRGGQAFMAGDATAGLGHGHEQIGLGERAVLSSVAACRPPGVQGLSMLLPRSVDRRCGRKQPPSAFIGIR